jgi:uncharacterized membrane protein
MSMYMIITVVTLDVSLTHSLTRILTYESLVLIVHIQVCAVHYFVTRGCEQLSDVVTQ